MEERAKTLRNAASAHPQELRYQLEYLSGLIDLDMIDEAVMAGPAIVESFPKSSEAFVQLGRALTRDGSFDLARIQFQRAIAIDGASSAAHAWVGKIDLARGDLRSAEAALRKALSIDPAQTEARYSLASLLERSGKYSEARSVLEGGGTKEAGKVELKGRWALLQELEKHPAYELPAGFSSVTVPMKRARGLPPLVSVKLSESFEKLFVLDTGSDEMVLSPDSARALGFPLKGTATIKDEDGREYPTPAWVVLERASLGALTVKHIPARVSPGLHYPVEEIGGVIGRDFLRHFRPVLDYPARMLTLGRPDGPPLDGVAFDIMGVVLISASRGDHEIGKFVLDTSSYTPAAFDVQLVAAETGLTVFDKEVHVLPEGPYLFKFTMPNLTVGGLEFREFPATAVDLRMHSRQAGVKLRGIIGNSFLRQCRLEIDFRNQRLSLKRSAAQAPAGADPGA